MSDSPLARYVVPLRRWWWAIVAPVVVAMALVLLMMPDAPPTQEELADEATSFRATHLLIRNDTAPTQLSFDLILLLANQGDLTNRIAEAAGEEIEPEDVETVQLSTDANTSTMSVTAVRPTAQGAADLATTYALELVAFLDERARTATDSDYQRVTERIGVIESDIEQLQEDLEALPADDIDRQVLSAELNGLLNDFSVLRTQQRNLEDQRRGEANSFLTLEEPSPVPVTDDGDVVAALQLPGSLPLRLALTAIAAGLVGIVGVLVLDTLDTRVRTRRDAEDAFGLPVLAELPRRSRRSVKGSPLPALSHQGGVTAEVLRALRLSLSLAPTWQLSSLSRDADGPVGSKTPSAIGGELRSVVVTSPLTGDGKSTLVANLAVSLAEGGKRVLIVDCDFRRPAVGDFLDIESGPGLRELAHLTERPLLDLASPTVAPNVAMIRSGTVGVTPSWFMASADKLVEACLDVADVVVFDTGPITLTNEASALLPHVDTSLLVVRAGKVATDQARGTVEQLTQVSASVSGIVLVGSEARRRYGYGYYSARAKGERKGAVDPEARSESTSSTRPGGGRDMWQARPGEATNGDKVPEEVAEGDRQVPAHDRAADDLEEHTEPSGRGASS